MALNNPFANRKKSSPATERAPKRSFSTPEEPDDMFDQLTSDEEEEVFIPRIASKPQPSSAINSQALPDFDLISTNTEEPTNTQVNHTPTPSIPATPFKKIKKSGDSFNQFLEDSDSEDEDLKKIRSDASLSNLYEDGRDPVIAMIGRNIKSLRNQYPTGGIKASRFITTEVLVNTPAGYFDKYLEDINNGVAYVRDKLSESDRSEIVRKAQDNPTDDGLQESVFSVVHSMASDFMQRSGWRDEHRAIIVVMICNEIIGFSRLEPLWRDRTIDEIICNGPFDIQVEIRGELVKVPGCYFNNQTHLVDLIKRLYGAIGKTFTMTTALIKGRLHDKSRMFAVHPVVAPDGPNFSIRRHPDKFWTPQALIDRGAASEEVMSFIGNLIYKGASVAVVGGTSSGKTSMLNALTGFYKPKVRIFTLEDNIEMKPNPKKYLAAAMECRQPAIDKPDDHGITMRDLVKSSLQLRPDVLIVGEVTDEAAFDLCQALNTGHAGASTIHANSSEEAIPRIASLIAQGGIANLEGALDLISSAFDFIVNVKHFPIDGSRRIVSIDEVGTTPQEIDGRMTLPVFPLWKFVDEGLDSEGKVAGYWVQMGDISAKRKQRKLLDIEQDQPWEVLKELSSIPEQEEDQEQE